MNEIATHAEVQRSEPQRDQAAALGASRQREEKGVERTVVRFIGYRLRPLDPDNFAGGCKDLLDGLRHAGLLHGDEPWRIKFQTEQIKVSSRSEERTVVQIEYQSQHKPSAYRRSLDARKRD